jgi:hypothetical protein
MGCLDKEYPRKQEIGCLGEHCDDPCDLQQSFSELTVEHLVPAVKYLGTELNKFIIKDD